MKVGQYVKIKKEYSDRTWYNDDIFKIISMRVWGVDVYLLKVDYNFSKNDSIINNDILSKYCEIYPMRKIKIKRLLE